MSRALLAALAIAAYALSLFVHVPAHFALDLDSSGIDRYVREPEGGLWNGRGMLYLEGKPVGPLAWEIAPLTSLASGCWHITAKVDRRAAAMVEVCDEAWSISDLIVRLDAAAIASRLGLPPGSAGGVFETTIERLEIDASRLSASGEIIWRSASAGLGVSLPLGTVFLNLSPERQHTRIHARNEAGAIAIALTANLDRQLNYQVSGTLGAVSGGPALEQLGIIGERAADGAYQVRHAGNLSR